MSIDYASGFGFPMHGGFGDILSETSSSGGRTQIKSQKDGGQIKILDLGPRLESRTIAFSAWGTVIPVTFGVRKLNGNVIWCAQLDELVLKQTNTSYPGQSSIPSLELPGLSAGFGSPGVKTTTIDYYYFADFAVSFGYGDPTNANKYILRIWANGLLIYDARAPGDNYGTLRTPVSKFDSLQFKFFPGTMDQAPSAIIQKHENARYAEENGTSPDVNVVPAMLGQMYLVFEGFPVTPFNNALPDIQIELADAATITNDVNPYDGAGSYAAQSACIDWNNLLLYETNGTSIRVIDLTTLAVVSDVAVLRVKNPLALPDAEGNAIAGLDISRGTGSLYAHTPAGEPIQVFSVNPYTGVCTPTSHYGGNLFMGPYSSSYMFPSRLFVTSYTSIGNIYDEIILAENSGGTKLFSSEEGTDPFLNNFYTGIGLREDYCPGEIGNLRGVFYINYDDFIWRYQGGKGEKFCGGVSVSFFQYIPQYNALLVCYDDGTHATFHLIDVASKADIWVSPVMAGGFASLTAAPLWKSDTKSNQLLFLRGGAITILDMTNGHMINERTAIYPASLPMPSGRFKAIFGAHDYYFLDQATALRTNLKLFILFVARLAGLDVDSGSPQLTVEDTLADIKIDGSYLNQVGQSFRALLDNLRQGFLFDVRESDGHIVVAKRAIGASGNDFTFYQKNMLMLDGHKAQALAIERAEDEGIPIRLTYTFLDYMNEYQPNVAYAQRSAASFSNQSANITVPIIMRFSEAKVWAYKILYSFWNTRENFSVRVPFSEVKTEPSDVGAINCDGRVYRVKVNRISYNTDWSMSVALTNYVDEALITIPADDPLGYVPALEYYSPSTAYMFDIPNVFPRDSDFIRDARLASLLFIASPDVPTRRWNGAYLDITTIYGQSYHYLFTNAFPEIALIGTTLSALLPTNAPFSIDDDSVLIVRVHPALTLTTISDALFFTGEVNVMAVRTYNGSCEIVSFRDVEDIGANMYKLRHFLRGRRGTEWQVNNHTLSNTFVFLVNNMQLTIPVDARAKDTDAVVVATTQGRDTLSTTAHETIHGYWQLPFQPSGVTATRAMDGTVTFKWNQRTRAPGGESFITGHAEPVLPAWENVIKFELYFPNDFWFPPVDLGGGAIGDHVSFFDDGTDHRAAFNPVKATLTLAQQTAIFGATLEGIDVVNVAVYQHSKEWGRGVGVVKEVYIT